LLHPADHVIQAFDDRGRRRPLAEKHAIWSQSTEQIWLIGALSPALTVLRLTSTDSAIGALVAREATGLRVTRDDGRRDRLAQADGLAAADWPVSRVRHQQEAERNPTLMSPGPDEGHRHLERDIRMWNLQRPSRDRGGPWSRGPFVFVSGDVTNKRNETITGLSRRKCGATRS